MRACVCGSRGRYSYQHSTCLNVQSERVFGRFIRFYAALITNDHVAYQQEKLFERWTNITSLFYEARLIDDCSFP
jgi:hypothetical protein